MIGLVVAGVLSTCFLVYCFKNAYKKPPNFPPGPPTLPVLGAYPLVKILDWNNLAMSFLKLSKIYKTKLLGAILANVPTVTVHDPKLIKDFLNEEQFDGRMDIILFRLRSYWKKLGIFFTDGYFWHTQRRFSLRYMRDYGFGRRSDTLEETVQNEIKEMIDMTINGPKYPAEKELVKGDLVYLPHYFAVPFINGMCHVFARMTLPRSEYHVLWDLARSALLFQRNSDDMGGFLSLQPWVKDVFPKWSGFKGLTEGNQYMLDFFGRLIDEVMATQDDSYDRHFLDMYVRKMKEEQRTKEKTTYSVEQLRLICVDYMFPAASATESVLTMLVERLLLSPEIQDKIHEEIDRVVGRDRMPTLDDRKK
ncbi:cytochrome p450 domain-containing protein [Phthorimaea operculella]|nr:cytochrome p450 domain-containing protein [Phthorimaea operculella]